MKKSIFIIMFLLGLTGCDTLLTEGGNQSETLSEIILSENEKVIFSMLADEIFYFDYTDSSKQFRSLEVGVDYYHYGKLSEVSGGLKMDANDPDTEWEDDRARFLFSMDWEEEKDSPSIKGDMSIIYNSGTKGSSSYSFTLPSSERGVRTSGYLLDQTNISYGEKMYVAYFVENIESDSMRSFDAELATAPNDEFEHVFMFYLIINR